MTTTITATAEPTEAPPRFRLNVTTNQTSLTLYRVAGDGSRVPVRSFDGGPFVVTGSPLVAYDPEAPFGEVVTYTSSDAATTPSAAVSLDVAVVWMISPGVPSRSIPVQIAEMSERSRGADQSVRYPLGRRFPIVANDGRRKAATYTLTLRTAAIEDEAVLDALLDDNAPLFLNVPADRRWGFGSEYVAIGDVSASRPFRYLGNEERLWSLPCSVVDRPAGGSQAFNTYGLSKSLYATYGDRHTAHATYGAAFNT